MIDGVWRSSGLENICFEEQFFQLFLFFLSVFAFTPFCCPTFPYFWAMLDPKLDVWNARLFFSFLLFSRFPFDGFSMQKNIGEGGVNGQAC